MVRFVPIVLVLSLGDRNILIINEFHPCIFFFLEVVIAYFQIFFAGTTSLT